MKKSTLLIASTLLLATLSASTFAFERVDRETVLTAPTATKAEAYAMGVNKLSSLKSHTPQELSYKLGPGNIEAGSLNIKDGFITVQERANSEGKISYVGIVNIDVGYVFEDSDD